MLLFNSFSVFDTLQDINLFSWHSRKFNYRSIEDSNLYFIVNSNENERGSLLVTFFETYKRMHFAFVWFENIHIIYSRMYVIWRLHGTSTHLNIHSMSNRLISIGVSLWARMIVLIEYTCVCDKLSLYHMIGINICIFWK